MEAHVRGAEILFSLARATGSRNKTTFSQWDTSFTGLNYAREYLSLFQVCQYEVRFGYRYRGFFLTSLATQPLLSSLQHHDGITGTSKDKVTSDYGTKLVTSLMKTKEVMVASAQYLIANTLGIDSPGTDDEITRQIENYSQPITR